MNDLASKASQSTELSAKVKKLLQKRLTIAQEKFTERARKAYETFGRPASAQPSSPMEMWSNLASYGVDFAQRSVLFMDTMRQRGNVSVEHVRAGLPPVLHFKYEMEMDGRELDKPVNYALVRIVPPEGVKVDARKRPYVIIDPRAGHGPGVGGMKEDSEVGVALRAGHPVYFVIFFPEPQPGQTLLDVCNAEKQFVQHVRELHPHSSKPAIVGNCQGGWAAMMLASSNPDDTGPVVINGAPMSYWGGAWEEGEGDNPMRYAGGALGGTWLASFTSDLAGGIFDGAWLVQNFDSLNPANTFWDKYYHVFKNADTEPPRFLEFERWYGGFYLMNREEIEWITKNLFVGNKLWKGDVKNGEGAAFDLRAMKMPIILFASMGDNITPPEQAFNWVADVYGSTEEIKSRGQVIVGLVHKSIGHLGIFVSGKVATKEHAQIVNVMECVEALPPGLYAMHIKDVKSADGKLSYEVDFEERRLEEVVERLNRFKRVDEQPFEAVAAVSDMNQRAYEMFAQPLVQAIANETSGKLQRAFHPLRVQRWAMSDLNPAMWWLKPAAEMVKQQRKAVSADHPLRQNEQLMAELTSAGLDYYRGVRDAASEAQFFQLYGNVFSLFLADKPEYQHQDVQIEDPRDLPVVQEALALIDQGGYSEALARAAYLLARKGEPLPLERVQLKKDLLEDERDLLPAISMSEARRVRGEQELIVRYAPERAVETLPKLLPQQADRERLLLLLEHLLANPRVQKLKPLPEQMAMLERIRHTIGANGSAKARVKVRAAAPAKTRTKAKAPAKAPAKSRSASARASRRA
jgi:pimeloyl-ACP methyl ester carboxylesterase